MLKMRDRYLHTNCLAALANVSGLFKHLQITDSLSLCRTIQYNMLKMRDRYLHTNCLAALANMPGLFKHLHMTDSLSLCRTIQYSMPRCVIATFTLTAWQPWPTCLACSSVSK